MKPGVRIAVDVGDVRVGVAVSDPTGTLATPLATLARDRSGGADPADLVELVRLAREHAAVEMVVGLPRSLSGRDGPAARKVRAYADQLARQVAPVPVRLADERLSTVLAERQLAGRGMAGRRRRAVVDQAAAVVILQSWLDAQRATARDRG